MSVFALLLLGYLSYPWIAGLLARDSKASTQGQPETSYNLVPILCFHNLDGKGIYSIERSLFRRYLATIRDEGIQVIPLRTLYRHAVSNRRFSKPSMVITVDDDYENIGRVAAPILREFAYPATFFFYTRGIKKDPRDGLAWEDLRRLRSEGFDIQNHSFSHGRFHVPMPDETPADYARRVNREIVYSRHVLSTRLPGLDVYAFAYPMGYHSPDLRRRLFSAGYRLLLTTDASPVDLNRPFDGTFHRYTVQRKKHIRDPERMFRLQLSFAKRPYRGDRTASVSDAKPPAP